MNDLRGMKFFPTRYVLCVAGGTKKFKNIRRGTVYKILDARPFMIQIDNRTPDYWWSTKWFCPASLDNSREPAE